MKAEKLDQYLRIAKAAKMLGVSQNTLRSWADAGRIAVSVNPANGYRLFKPEDIEAFLKNISSSNPTRKAK